MSQTLTPLDAAFLHVESDRTPMHMASIAIFEAGPLEDEDGNLRIDELRRLIESRLDLVPKLRQRAHDGLLHEAPPVWTDEPSFDIADHVRTCRLPEPGTEVELGQLAGQILATPLDRQHPLWELIFVEGLCGHRTALIEKLHHSMADGIAAAELATVLLDLTPDTPTVERTVWAASEAPSTLRSTVRDIEKLGALSLRLVAWGGWTVLHPIRRSRSWAKKGEALRTLITPRTFAPRSPLNGQIGPKREVHFVRLDLEEVREVAHRSGATINDAVLAIVTGGLRELLLGRGELDSASQMQALVPVGLATGEGRGMANRVSAYFVRLPVGQEDPMAALRAIAADTTQNKQHHQELAADAVLQLLEPLPQSLLALGSGLINYQPFFNLIVTNVPGPTIPLYALGAELLEAFPIVPLAGNQGIGVAALSYGGHINLGIFTDPDLCPDIETFCEGVRSTQRALSVASVGG
jgi:WS/DGAT/MGAT family acyltransferase